MKHQICRLFVERTLTVFGLFLLLCTGYSTVFAQQKTAKDDSIPPGLFSPLDKFLIEDANPPLRLSDISRSVAMLEWATEASFNQAELEEFKQLVIADWRNKNQETIRFITDWVAFADRLSAMKKYADQIALKEKTRPVVVADLKKYPNDPKREIIRRIYRRKHGANSLGAFKAEPKIIKTGGTLKDLVGDWMIQSNAGMKTVKFSFLANGRVTFGDSEAGQKGNCFISETKSKEGTAQISDNNLRLDFTNVRLQRINSCQPAASKVESLPAESQQLTWQIKSDENEMLQLCLTAPGGTNACYRKAN